MSGNLEDEALYSAQATLWDRPTADSTNVSRYLEGRWNISEAREYGEEMTATFHFRDLIINVEGTYFIKVLILKAKSPMDQAEIVDTLWIGPITIQ